MQSGSAGDWPVPRDSAAVVPSPANAAVFVTQFPAGNRRNVVAVAASSEPTQIGFLIDLPAAGKPLATAKA